MAQKPKKTGQKPSAAAVATKAGCSRQLAARLLGRGFSEADIVARIKENRRREAERLRLRLPTTPVAVIDDANGNVVSFAHAQTRKELALAKLRELELLERRQELMPVVYMKKWGCHFLAQAKDELMRGPGELQDALAAETDPVKCAEILSGFVYRTLEKFFQLDRLWNPPLENLDAHEVQYRAAKLAVIRRA